MSEHSDIAALWAMIEDHLIPKLKLNAHERSVYYHLVRHSRLLGERSIRISVDSLAERTGLSTQVRYHLRSLHNKGCVRIVERGRTGTEIEVLTPSEIPGCVLDASEPAAINLETFNVYADPLGRAAIFARERGACFYCLRSLDQASAVLDHAIPRVVREDHTYRNVVCSCHECNSLKAGSPADEFLRLLYRRGRISSAELEARLSSLDLLARGDLKPELQGGTPR